MIMIGVIVLFLILIIRNVTFVAAKPVQTTETTTIVYKNPGYHNSYYVPPPPSHYNSYKAQYYN